MNSGSVVAGTDGFTTTTYDSRAAPMTGAISRMKSKLIGVERGIDRIRRHDLQQRVAIGRRLGDHLGADVAAGARAILDDELLAEALRQPLTHQARLDVGGPSGRKADDDAHRPRWIGLRPG